ncbi:MAG: hypothetical protein SFV15_23725 [Polyangiaceae bacterium]|nr:hypothetical protein [Polyangiaceae bacterium]
MKKSTTFPFALGTCLVLLLGSRGVQAKDSDAPEASLREPEAMPPPAPPKPSDQSPAPYLETPSHSVAPRKVELGPDVGLLWRSTDGAAKYRVAWAFGGHVRVVLLPWLLARVAARQATHEVDLGNEASLMGSPSKPLTARASELQGAIEPEWRPLPQLALSGGPTVSWQYLTAPAPSSGALKLVERHGSFLQFGLNMNVAYEPIPDWLAIGLHLNPSIAIGQRGDFFRETQGFDAAGNSVRVPGLPRPEGTVALGLSLSLVR